MPLAPRSTLIATTLAIGAIAAPIAHASTPPTAQGAPPILPAASSSELQSIRRAEASASGYDAPRAGRYSNAELNAYASALRSVAVASPTGGSTGSDFDYADAAVGAGITGGTMLLLGAAGLAVHRRKQLQHR